MANRRKHLLLMPVAVLLSATALRAIADPAPLPSVKALMAEVLPPTAPRMSVSELVALASRNHYAPMGTRAYTPTDPIHWLFFANDPADVNLFRPLLHSNNELLLGAACLYVGRIKDLESFDTLAELTQNPSPAVRRMAVEALGMLGTPEAVPLLVNLESDPDGDVRDRIPSALHQIPGEEASRALLGIYLHAEKSLRRDTALRILRERQDVCVLPDLIGVLTKADKGFDADMLRLTIEELSGHNIIGDYGDPAACAQLKQQWEKWWSENGSNLSKRPRIDCVPESTYCGIGIILRSAEHQYRDNTVQFHAEPVGDGGGGVPFMKFDGTPLLLPVSDDSLDNFTQYVLFLNGREIERGDVGSDASSYRYSLIPFGPIARGVTVRQDSFETGVAPGDYELQIEVRSLCTELTYFDYQWNAWGRGARETKGESFTLRSNRVPLRIHAPTSLSSESMEELARIMNDRREKCRAVTLEYTTAQGESFTKIVPLTQPSSAAWLLRAEGAAALPAVLAHFDAKAPTYAQLDFLKNCDSSQARVALEEVRALGDEQFRSILEQQESKSVAELVAAATREIDAQGWSWHESREALVALDGKLGPEKAEFAKAFASELEQRLDEKRDRHAGRPGESLWGAFRTAFLLGRIGDPVAVPVLRRAAEARTTNTENWETNSQSMFLRWYAAAALKLIEVQNLPESQRSAAVKDWIRHCFSSPEEHFMARSRLLPYLRELLGEEGPAFFAQLTPTLDDPWMVSDAKRLADAGTRKEQALAQFRRIGKSKQ